MSIGLPRPRLTPEECLATWNGPGNAAVRAETRPPRGPVPDGPYEIYVGPIRRLGSIAAPPPAPAGCVWFRWAGAADTPPAMLAIATTPALDCYDLAGATLLRGPANTSLTNTPRARQLDDGSLVLVD